VRVKDYFRKVFKKFLFHSEDYVVPVKVVEYVDADRLLFSIPGLDETETKEFTKSIRNSIKENKIIITSQDIRQVVVLKKK